MNQCPPGQLNTEQVTNQLLNEGALIFEEITKPDVVAKIVEELGKANPGLPVYQDVDKYVLYVADKYSYLVDFFQGCSRAAYNFDFDSTIRFFKFLDGLPL
jgi:hypothetical protein